MHALINGKRIPEELAQTPLDGYLAADGLAVATRLDEGKPFRLEAHLQNLAAGLAAPAAHLEYALNPRQTARELADLVAAEKPGAAAAAVLAVLPDGDGVRTAVFLRPLPAAAALADRGVTLTAAGARFPDEPWAALPWVHTPWTRAVAAASARADADGGVLAAPDGTPLCAVYADRFLLGDAAASAVFAVVDGALLTPDPERHILPPNVMRRAVEEAAARLGVVVYHEPLTPKVLAAATEVFTADSVRGILPVRRLADGAPGAEKTARDFAPGALAARLARTVAEREKTRGC